MKVDLSKEEYRVLVEAFFAGMVLDAYGRGNAPKRNCRRIGTEDLCQLRRFWIGRYDPHSNELAKNGIKAPEKKVRIYDQFVDDAFWEELILGIDRDLQAEMTLSG